MQVRENASNAQSTLEGESVVVVVAAVMVLVMVVGDAFYLEDKHPCMLPRCYHGVGNR